MTTRSIRSGGSGPRLSRVGTLGDRLLTVMAVVGAASLVIVIVTLVFQVSILMFRTGSMSPTIPAGSLAVAREIPASAMSTGDIVTVDRDGGALPITHRVVEIIHTDPVTGAVTFQMRGDANDATDPRPYTATEVRLVMFSVPHLAKVVQWFDSPFALGSLTLVATALVGWAFWPRDDDEEGDAAADDSTDDWSLSPAPWTENRGEVLQHHRAVEQLP